MDNIHNSGFIPFKERMQESGQGALGLQGQTVRLQGEWVQCVPVSQSLADAAEELTFAFSERVGRSLAKRKIDDANTRGQLKALEELAQLYSHKVSDLESVQKLQDFLARLMKNTPDTLAQLQTYLNDFSREISHQFLALNWVKNQLAEHMDARALLSLIDSAMSTMARDNSQSIELGIVVSPLIAQVASHPEELQALRETCRDAVCDCNGLAQAMKNIQMRFGDASVALEKAIDILMKMLAADYLDIHLDQVKRTLIVRNMRWLHILKKLREDVDILWGTLVVRERIYGIRSF